MSQEIPKPLRNALARQAVGEVHPSPDVLTSFLERTLPAVESEVVTHHLAQCTECREIVFLASDAAEDEVSAERELVAAGARPLTPVPVYAAHARPAGALAEQPRPRRRLRLAWTVPIAATALLVSGVLTVELWRSGGRHSETTLAVANNRVAAPSSAGSRTMAQPAAPTAVTANPPVSEARAKGAPRAATSARLTKVPQANAVASEPKPAPAAEPAPSANFEASGVTIGGVTPAVVPAMPMQNGFAESDAGRLQLQSPPAAGFAKSVSGMYAARAIKPQWRIGADGHVERSTGSDEWTRALSDQPVTFRVVAAVGNNVWAGGNGGALFHSSDGGQHWSKVSVAAGSKIETGAIVSIRFLDTEHGTVISESGSRWATIDGGATWTTTP
jgi:Photosynthesis system II assembly factor YCF48